MSKKLDKKSIKYRFYRGNLFLAICVLSFLLFSNIYNNRIMQRYDNLMQAYLNVENTYNKFNEASMYFKEYLYTENKNKLQKYHIKMLEAIDKVKTLKNNPIILNGQRFQLLENMYASYNETCITILYNNTKYEENYNLLQRYEKLIMATSSEYYELITVSMQYEKEALDTIKKVIHVLSVLLLCIVLFWILYFVYNIIHFIMKPLDQILLNIQKIKEGKYDLSNVSMTSIEMEQLCCALNEMAEQVQKNFEYERDKAKLKQELLKQENENLRKDELLTQSELKMLQNQINPHFLFNTLNMIHCLVDTNQTKIASQMILHTSQLLRYGLEMQNSISTISLELKAIKSYIEIQKLRVSDRIEFVLNIENEDVIGNMNLPGMILQPLVENSIKHGLNNCMEDGEIEIYIAKENDIVTIEVSDNGVGMLQKIMDEKIILYNSSEYNEPHFGLYNVIRRLQAFYKERVQIQIITDINSGFSFIIHIKT